MGEQPDDIESWLSRIGLGKYAQVFADNEIDLAILPALSEEDLRELGLPLGPRRKLRQALADRTAAAEAPRSRQPATTPEGERRQVTVLFADLTGFTRLSSELDAEELHGLLNRYFAVADGIVERYGGTIDKHIGDSVMAVFGAPVAHTDDPERAVRVACDIHEAIKALSGDVGHDLRAHIGVASGQVVASGTGSDAHREYTVTGETVNLASRLSDLAAPGETWISKAVHNAVWHAISCVPKGEVEVAGVAKPVDVWAVDRAGRQEAPVRQGPFVGRRLELRQFRAFLEECREQSRGQNILVRGEPGIGKTRLVNEFVAIAQAFEFATHRSLVLDFGGSKEQDTIRTLLQSLLGVSPGGNIDARQAAIDEAVSQTVIAEERRVYLNDLLDLPQPLALQSLYDAMDGATRNAGRRDTVVELVSAMAQSCPLLVVIEDIHWADQATLEYLRRLASAISGCAAIMVMTSRLEGVSLDQEWLASLRGTPMTTVELQPLQRDETLALATGLTQVELERLETYVARSEGNPLFLEQLLRNASEAADDNVPGTIQGLVLARMDRLPRVDKEALQAASVIGQSFSLDALRHLISNTAYNCRSLIEHRLVRPDGSKYLFDHALIRDAVYASLLQARRKELHAHAAQWYSEGEPVLRAEHLDRAQDALAPRAYLQAAEAEAKAYRFERAIGLLERGAEIAEGQEDRFALVCRMGEFQLDLGSVEQAMQNFKAAGDLAAKDVARCQAWIGLAASYRLADRHGEALDLLKQAEQVARTNELNTELARLWHLRGNLLFMLGDLPGCRDEHQRALELSRHIASSELEARALGGLADASYAEGRWLTAHEQFRQCVKIARELGLGSVVVANRSMIAFTGIMLHPAAEALADAQDAIASAQQFRHVRAEMIGRHSAHYACMLLNEPESAREHSERALEIARQLGSQRFEAEALMFIGETRLAEGRRADAFDMMSHALKVCRQAGMAYMGPMILAATALTSDDSEERADLLAEGEALLRAGSLSHNHIFFYRYAIEASLESANWAEVVRFAEALALYTKAEPMPLSDLIIDRARALASHGRGDRHGGMLDQLRELRDRGEKFGYRLFLSKVAEALEED